MKTTRAIVFGRLLQLLRYSDAKITKVIWYSNHPFSTGYEYDYENRIIKITKDSTDIAEFSYDALGRRIEKKDLVDPNNTRRYYYNYNWQVLCDANDSDVFQNWYAYGNYIDEVLMTNKTNFGFAFTRFYAHDHLYSPVALLWSGGAIERYEYDAYGKVKILNADFTADADNTSDYGNPYLFTARRYDTETGMYYYRARYYHPEIGRFLQPDPIHYYSDLNLYSYVLNNPVKWIDPLGDHPLSSNALKECIDKCEKRRKACRVRGRIACFILGRTYGKCASMLCKKIYFLVCDLDRDLCIIKCGEKYSGVNFYGLDNVFARKRSEFPFPIFYARF